MDLVIILCKILIPTIDIHSGTQLKLSHLTTSPMTRLDIAYVIRVVSHFVDAP